MTAPLPPGSGTASGLSPSAGAAEVIGGSRQLDAEMIREEQKRIESLAKSMGLDTIALDSLPGLREMAQAIQEQVVTLNDLLNYARAKKGLNFQVAIIETPSIHARKQYPEIRVTIQVEL